MILSPAISSLSKLAHNSNAVLSSSSALQNQAILLLGMVLAAKHRSSPADIYNILWMVVFGFATLNILGLAARHMEPNRRGMSFGEVMAVTVVLLSIFLLGWELLGLFHIFPIKLRLLVASLRPSHFGTSAYARLSQGQRSAERDLG